MSLNPVVRLGSITTQGCECGCRSRRPRYPSDLSDAEWDVLRPLLPAPLSLTGGRGGRPEKHHRRSIIDAIRYVCDNGVKWRALPADFPPWPTVYGIFAIWSRDLVWEYITDRLRPLARKAKGRNPRLSAGCIDSQSVPKSADAVVPKETSGFDSFKKVNGRKRHIVVDVLGFLVSVVVTRASVPDRYAAKPLLTKASRRGVRHTWADRAYEGGDLTPWAQHILGMTIEVVQRSQHGRGHGFQLIPRRWVVERTFAWIGRRRRCVRDYERLPSSHEAWVHIAASITMTRVIARHSTRSA